MIHEIVPIQRRWCNLAVGVASKILNQTAHIIWESSNPTTFLISICLDFLDLLELLELPVLKGQKESNKKVHHQDTQCVAPVRGSASVSLDPTSLYSCQSGACQNASASRNLQSMWLWIKIRYPLVN